MVVITSSRPSRRTQFQSYRDSSTKELHPYDDNSSDEEPSEEESEGEYLAPLECSDDDADDANENNCNDSVHTTKVLSDKTNTMDKESDSKKTKTNRRDAMKKLRRRRSSARFLSMSRRFEGDEVNGDGEAGEDGNDDKADSTEATIRNNRELGEMYRQAIRMNTENRINAGNSWNFGLIENIDKFLCDDDDSGDIEENQESFPTASTMNSSITDDFKMGGNKRVNFTKASCTLDASVKIYSYRVDDVHLTSYKVLANLNRTDKGKDDDKNASDQPSQAGQRKQSERRNMDSTIETNIANLNMGKMDSALDIDPLFHKMSKSFDEGGAKGLLLVNLGVASDSCRIVFDSNEVQNVSKSSNSNSDVPVSPPMATISEDEEHDKMEDDENEEKKDELTGEEKEDVDMDDKGDEGNDDEIEKDEFANVESNLSTLEADIVPQEESNGTMVDISMLSSKFESLLNGSSFATVPFMPQMRSVREEYGRLEAEGFVTNGVSPLKSKRYAISAQEEKEAEEVIHREALERTRMTEANTNSFAADSAFGGNDNDNFGDEMGDMDDHDDMDGGDDFDDDPFSATMNQTMEIQPSFYADNDITFNEDFGFMKAERGGIAPFNEKKSTVRLLDIICNTDTMNSGGRYEYFDTATLQRMTAGNSWAGSAHWKKSEKLFRKKRLLKKNTTSDSEQKKTKSKGEQTFVDLFSSDNLDITLGSICKPAKAKRGYDDPLHITKAAMSKQEKADNLLPHDADIGVEKLFRLFLRPNSTVVNERDPETQADSQKRVAFQDNFFGDGEDSFGNDEEQPAFNILDGKGDINDVDDFVVNNLEGVRKVEKVEVGYATVAKKVDVRRLKNDLWAELEERVPCKFDAKPKDDPDEIDPMDSKEGMEEANSPVKEKQSGKESEEEAKDDVRISFQEIVDCLDESQRQEDVSVAFYFICLLHLANEKGLALDASGCELIDFMISRDDGKNLSLFDMASSNDDPVHVPKPRKKKVVYSEDSDDNENGDEMSETDGDMSDGEYSDD